MFLHELIQEGVVLVDFLANWCESCKELNLILEEVQKKTDIKIVKLGVDRFTNLVKRYVVMSIPPRIVFKESKRTIDYLSKDVILNVLNV